MTNVCVIGLWHLGLVHVVGFARCGLSVTGMEFDTGYIKKLRKGIVPVYEPGLRDELREGLRNRRITLSSSAPDVSQADYVVLSYDTPVAENGRSNIGPIVSAVRHIASFIGSQTPLIITSQIPVGTSGQIAQMIRKHNPKWKSGVVYVPENIKLGSAIARFAHPDMLIFGSDQKEALRAVLELYRPIHTKKIFLTLTEAEMVKHTINAFLATSISFGNEIAGLCEKLGIDATNVLSAAKKDVRIRGAPIAPGLGFSGATILRDVVSLKNYAKRRGYKADLMRGVYKVNEETFRYVRELANRAVGRVKGKTIGFLGLTYKPGTSTMRHSPSVILAKEFIARGAMCIAYDPMASAIEVGQYRKYFARVQSPVDLAKKSDVILLVTPWPTFATLSYERLARVMKRPILIDTKNFLDPTELKRAGFLYIGYGR